MNAQPVNQRNRFARQQGFTMIEALVALLVMAFGMLAIAGFQITMSRNSDVAKQRSEAVRLAQREMERLRTFETVVSDGAKIDYVELLGGTRTVDSAQLSAADNQATNTSYTVTWGVTRFDGTTATATNAAMDAEKWINVGVTWTDRAGGAQTVRLRSVVSRADPIDLGTLATGPGGTKTRTPKNRNVNIPYPATDVGGGESAFQPPGLLGQFYVFNNTSGDVVKLCTGTIASYATASCVTKAAYLLSGYIRFLYTNVSGNEAAQDAAVSNATGNLLNLTASIADTSAASSPCYVQRQKVVRYSNPPSSSITTASISSNVATVNTGGGNNGFSIGQIVIVSGSSNAIFDGQYVLTGATSGSVSYALTGSGSSTGGKVSLLQDIVLDEASSTPSGYSVSDKFIAYTCVIEHYTSGSIVKSWWGRFVITPALTLPAATVWGMANSGSNANSCDTTPASGCNYKLCRFSGDYINDGVVSNTEHPLYYRAVSYTLDNQNYLVVNSNASCPTDGEVDIATSDYINTHTIIHQTAVAGTGGALSTGSQWTNAGEEPSSTTATIPMLKP